MKHWILAAATLLLMQSANAQVVKWTPPSGKDYKSSQSCPKQDCRKPACKPQDPCCPKVCYEKGAPTNELCTPSAYSEFAAPELRKGQDIRFSLSFLYWQAMQGGMDLAVPSQVNSVPIPDLTQLNPSPVGNLVLSQNFEYKPGFKIGAGWFGAKDNWVIYGEYTRFHGSSKTSATAPSPGVATVNGQDVPPVGVWVPTSWLPNASYMNQAASLISSRWQCDLDLVDLQLSRPFYSGMKLTLEPFMGFRTAIIDQKMKIESQTVPTATAAVNGPIRLTNYRSDSWGVGPRTGVNGNWLMGSGVRFIGNAATSLLYTRYTKVSGKSDSPDATGAGVLPVYVRQHSINTLRPNMDLAFGLGWSGYTNCRRLSWDFSATYDFNIFWDQNMMRSLADLTSRLTDGAAGNLYLHGLTLRAQINF